MSNESDMSSMIVGLLRELRQSIDKLTGEVHGVCNDLNLNNNGLARVEKRVAELDTWKTIAEGELRDLKPVAAVLEQMKRWVIVGAALFFMFGLLTVAGVYIWSKLPAGSAATPAIPPPASTAPDPTPSSPPSKSPRTRAISYF